MRFWGFGGIPSAGREVITYNDGDMSDGLVMVKVRERSKRSGVPFICWWCLQ
jgi:hypothetical protein